MCGVTAPPMWRNGRVPQNIDATEDDDVVLECNVIGRPKPTVTLTYNAKSIDQGLLHHRHNAAPSSPKKQIVMLYINYWTRQRSVDNCY